MVHQWHMHVEIDVPTLNMTGEGLKNKALFFQDKILHEFSECLKLSNIVPLQKFVVLNGWLAKYLKGISTSTKKSCREQNSLNPMQVEKCLHEIHKTPINVPLKCIFNIDKLALYHCTKSSRLKCTVNLDGRGVKQNKEQNTVTLRVCASSEKFAMQVITKSACPHALKNNLDISKAFGIIYDYQAKAWQDALSYMCLLHKYIRIAKNCNLIIYILQDNCSSHVFVGKMLDPSGSPEMLFWYQNLCIIYFPTNATSNCQPLDQGIIWSFKVHFCHAQLNHLMSEYKI
jgi:DDE superfamily endonuclease